jgi:hypothetical protein
MPSYPKQQGARLPRRRHVAIYGMVGDPSSTKAVLHLGARRVLVVESSLVVRESQTASTLDAWPASGDRFNVFCGYACTAWRRLARICKDSGRVSGWRRGCPCVREEVGAKMRIAPKGSDAVA